MAADIVKRAQDSVFAAHGENRLTAAFADDDISRRFDIFGAPDDDPRRFENAPFFDFEKAVVAVGGGIERPSAIDRGAGFGVGLGAGEIGGGGAAVGDATVGNGAVVGGNARRAVGFGRGFCGTGHHGFWRNCKTKTGRIVRFESYHQARRFQPPAAATRAPRVAKKRQRKHGIRRTRRCPRIYFSPRIKKIPARRRSMAIAQFLWRSVSKCSQQVGCLRAPPRGGDESLQLFITFDEKRARRFDDDFLVVNFRIDADANQFEIID